MACAPRPPSGITTTRWPQHRDTKRPRPAMWGSMHGVPTPLPHRRHTRYRQPRRNAHHPPQCCPHVNKRLRRDPCMHRDDERPRYNYHNTMTRPRHAPHRRVAVDRMTPAPVPAPAAMPAVHLNAAATSPPHWRLCVAMTPALCRVRRRRVRLPTSPLTLPQQRAHT